jgi:hypothetical protein
MVEAARGSLVLASTLAIGQWFQIGSESELWLLIWSDGRCLRFAPSGTECWGAGRVRLDRLVRLEQPWFEVMGRRQPIRLSELPIGSWFEWAGQPMLVVGGPGGIMAFDPLLWTELPADSIAVPLTVQLRTDRKPFRRWLRDWWRR